MPTYETTASTIDRAAAATDHAAEQALGAAQRSVAAIRERSQHLVERAQHASDCTVDYIRDEPVKAVLIAAATGATLMALVSLLSRSRHG